MGLHLNEPPDNNVMHAKSGLRVLLEWKVYRPDSVITDVITLSSNCSTEHGLALEKTWGDVET